MNKDKRYGLALSLLLLASVSVNFILARKLNRLTVLSRLDGALEIGASAPPLKVSDLSGRLTQINILGQSKPTVLYVFTPSCIWCRRNESSIKYLADHAGQQYRFIALSLTHVGLPEYVRKHELGFPIFCDPDDQTLSVYKLSSTPEMLVVSLRGNVLKNWVGAFAGRTQTEINNFFSVNLPNIN